jgi:hypothetical protein
MKTSKNSKDSFRVFFGPLVPLHVWIGINAARCQLSPSQRQKSSIFVAEGLPLASDSRRGLYIVLNALQAGREEQSLRIDRFFDHSLLVFITNRRL